MSPDERQIIKRDLDNLCRLDYRLTPTRQAKFFRDTFDFPFDCFHLRDFLERHIQLITKDWGQVKGVIRVELDHPPNWSERKYYAKLIETWKNYSYPYILQHARAAHLGALLDELFRQQVGDSARFYFAYPHDGGEEKLLLGPKSGIVQVSGRFFFSAGEYPNLERSDAMANSIFRLSSLFHEAMHSLGPEFNHIACRKKGRLRGRDSCDSDWRGSYGLQGMFLIIAQSLCRQCSKEEKAVLFLAGMERLEHINSRWIVGFL